MQERLDRLRENRPGRSSTSPGRWVAIGCGGLLLLSCICGIPAYLFLGVGTFITQTATVSREDANISFGEDTSSEDATVNAGDVGLLGEAVERAGVTLTVFSAERMSEFEGETPFSESDIFVVVELQVENNGSESMEVGTRPFELLSRDGDSYGADMMADPGEIEFGFLDIGDETRGRLVFEVDENASIADLVLSYAPMEFSSEGISPLQVALTDTPGTVAASEEDEEDDEPTPTEAADDDGEPTPAEAADEDELTPTEAADEDELTPTEAADDDGEPTPTAEDEPEAQPTPEPVDSDAPLSTVTNGANLRSEPRIAPDTVLAQVCPNDQVRILEEQGSWYRIQVAQMGDDCPVSERATVGMEGWMSQELLSAPSETLPVAAAEPTEEAEPEATEEATATGVPTATAPTAEEQATATAAAEEPTTEAEPEATDEAEPEATAAAEDEPTTEPGTIEGSVINGGNLRNEPLLAPETVIGQVCPGDQATILEERTVEGILWYQIRVTATGPDCIAERVPAGTEGWLSSVLISIP